LIDPASSYKYSHLKTERINDGTLVEVYLYKFRTHKKRKTYFARVERYEDDVFIIKFYQKRLEQSPNKYREITNEGCAIRILSTCLQIALDLLVKYPEASFGFHGARSEGEHYSGTQRFRIYQMILANHFGPSKTFNHWWEEDYSVYMMFNSILSKQQVNHVLNRFNRYYDLQEIIAG
jgi:hypothetical protein